MIVYYALLYDERSTHSSRNGYTYMLINSYVATNVTI